MPRPDRRARPGRHARLRRRAGRRAPRDARLGEPGRGGRRRHHHHLPARHQARRSTTRPWSISCCGARATPASCTCMPMAALTKGLKGEEMAEIGLLKAAGAVAFTDGARSVTNAQVMRRALTYARDFDALIVHHTEDPDLVGEGVMNEGEFAARLGLFGVPEGGRDHHAGARHAARRAVGAPLSRRLHHLRGIARRAAPRQGRRASPSPPPPRSIISRSTRSTSAPTAPSSR